MPVGIPVTSNYTTVRMVDLAESIAWCYAPAARAAKMLRSLDVCSSDSRASNDMQRCMSALQYTILFDLSGAGQVGAQTIMLCDLIVYLHLHGANTVDRNTEKVITRVLWQSIAKADTSWLAWALIIVGTVLLVGVTCGLLWLIHVGYALVATFICVPAALWRDQPSTCSLLACRDGQSC
jgi:hypothetical protein